MESSEGISEPISVFRSAVAIVELAGSVEGRYGLAVLAFLVELLTKLSLDDSDSEAGVTTEAAAGGAVAGAGELVAALEVGGVGEIDPALAVARGAGGGSVGFAEDDETGGLTTVEVGIGVGDGDGTETATGDGVGVGAGAAVTKAGLAGAGLLAGMG